MGLHGCCSYDFTISAERISHPGYAWPAASGATCHTCAHGSGHCRQACGHDVNGHYLFVNSAGAGARGTGDLGLFLGRAPWPVIVVPTMRWRHW